MTNENPYKVLGVKPTANDKQIKAAYRKQCNACHPDKHAGKDEVERNAYQQQFLRVQWAYEILSDPQERAYYDEHGCTRATRDNAPLSPVDQTIIETFRKGFDPRGSDLTRRDFVKDIRLALTDQRIAVRETLRAMRETSERLTRMEGRFLRAGDPHNVLARSIRADIDQLAQLIESKEEESAHLLACLKEIEHYSYKNDGEDDDGVSFRVRLTSAQFERIAAGVQFRQ